MKNLASIMILILVIAACSPVPATTEPGTPMLETPAVSSSQPTSTWTITPVVTTEKYPSYTPAPTYTLESFPTYTPAPTYTALPALVSGRALTLSHIYMQDEQNGWGIDGSEHIVHTKDGGYTWKDVTPQSGAYRTSGFFALDASTAWATPYQYGCYTEACSPVPNNATIWHTTDGGNSWQDGHVCLQSQDCRFDFDMEPSYYVPIALQFSDSKSGWLQVVVEHLMFQDRYRIYHTSDGGFHWSPVIDNIQGPMVMSVTGLAFQDMQTGWMSTSDIDGATDQIADWSLYQSMDAGHTWNVIPLPEPNPLPEVFAQNVVWCGAYGVHVIPPNSLDTTIRCRVYTQPSMSSYDFSFHSPDGGRNWNSWLNTGDADFIDPLVGWRLTLNNDMYDLEQTRDGGQTWTKLKSVQWNGDLDFVNEQVAWAIAIHDDVSALVRTTDGGKTWQELKPVVALR